MSTPFIPYDQINFDSPFYGGSIYGGLVWGSAYPVGFTQAVGWPAFFAAISDYLISANVFGPGSAFWAIDPDSVIQWPAGPTPFGMIVPRPFHKEDTDIGGGRFVKIWQVNIDIHIITANVFDQAYQDSMVVSSPSLTSGPYALVHLLIDKMEQAYIKTANQDFATVEFPNATLIGDIHRFKQTNQYVSIPVSFGMSVKESLPSTWFPVATPPSLEDLSLVSR
jgi:hypothetical protein